jgi:hypothetical protein
MPGEDDDLDRLKQAIEDDSDVLDEIMEELGDEDIIDLPMPTGPDQDPEQ